jgi:ATP-dependent DNA helicase RecG
MNNWTKDDVLALQEAVDIEFKKAAGRDGKGALPNEFWQTYSAFANTEGGEIFLGIEEKTDKTLNIVGIGDTARMKQEIFNLANNRQKVSANLLQNSSIEELPIDSKIILKVHVPRAPRKLRPVYVGSNPLTGTYKRRNEGDFVLDETTVKRMLAEQVEDSADARILKGYGIDDLDRESFTAYRSTFAALKPNHPFIGQEIEEFLRSIGAWNRDRETKEEGLTLAGLLMFGKLRSIMDEVPNYILDYQERPEAKAENRWIDRITTDGSWSGNLYDFYKRVYQKLTADLKVPFKLDGATRIEETPIHVALREALVNAIIHADYAGRVSVLIVKRPDMFGFRNPGLMRVPIEQALLGGDSDCRNRNLQKMFQFMGAGEQAGSGIPKIYQNWRQQHWRNPRITEKREPEQTLFELHTVSLLPATVLEKLDKTFGERFRKLPELERLILATAATEDLVHHKRITEITKDHPADISKALSYLTREEFLNTDGSGRGMCYFLPGSEYEKLQINSSGIPESSIGLSSSSLGLKASSLGLDQKELEIAKPAKIYKKLGSTKMEDIIFGLCDLRPQTIRKLAFLLDRSPEFLRASSIKSLIKQDKILLLYPNRLNHPNQAYITPRLKKTKESL